MWPGALLEAVLFGWPLLSLGFGPDGRLLLERRGPGFVFDSTFTIRGAGAALEQCSQKRFPPSFSQTPDNGPFFTFS